ncbi:MAG: type IV toxin-antitoxin system AbiEi family antitoxin domain-containing protein [Pseudomonadota bacterium]
MEPTQAITRVLKREGVADVQTLGALGLSRPTLFRALRQLEQGGRIMRLRRGVYAPASDRLASDTWGLALRRYPKGVLCLLSALAFHEITTQAPWDVWLALPAGSRAPGKGYPPIRAVYVSGAAYSAGIETHRRPTGEVRVYSVAKTVADCFKFRNRVGLDVALEALREGWRERRFTMEELYRMAQLCRMQNVMRPYMEALVA